MELQLSLDQLRPCRRERLRHTPFLASEYEPEYPLRQQYEKRVSELLVLLSLVKKLCLGCKYFEMVLCLKLYDKSSCFPQKLPCQQTVAQVEGPDSFASRGFRSVAVSRPSLRIHSGLCCSARVGSAIT